MQAEGDIGAGAGRTFSSCAISSACRPSPAACAASPGRFLRTRPSPYCTPCPSRPPPTPAPSQSTRCSRPGPGAAEPGGPGPAGDGRGEEGRTHGGRGGGAGPGEGGRRAMAEGSGGGAGGGGAPPGRPSVCVQLCYFSTVVGSKLGRVEYRPILYERGRGRSFQVPGRRPGARYSVTYFTE